MAQAQAHAFQSIHVDKPNGFINGGTANRGGRPKGAYSRFTSTPIMRLMAKETPAILRAMITAAKAGDVSAARIILDRQLPQGRCVKINLPKVKTAQDAQEVLSTLLDSASRGVITPSEGEALSRLARSFIDADTMKIEDRLSALESRISGEGQNEQPQASAGDTQAD